ncbi:MAG: hypothetical protein ACFFFH_07185 [Candidatus Thorarchaeota archaeon]
MSEVQKALAKAKENEQEGSFDKAARNYFTAAKLTNDIRLYNRAFFTARKSGRSDLMFETARCYHEMLEQEDQQAKVKELLPTFLEISGRERDRLAEEAPEEMVGVLDWTVSLFQLVGKPEAAYDFSIQTGDAYFSYGQQLLSSTSLIGKEEKWQRGLDLFDKAIEAYQKIRMDTQSLQKIFDVKLDRINKLIDIGHHVEGIEGTTELMDYHKSQSEKVPYSREVLSSKVAEIFAAKSMDYAQDKKFDVADVLMKTAKAGFENAGKYTEIPPFLWRFALIYDDYNQKDLFYTLTDTTFNMALKYEDQSVQQAILGYLDERAKTTCENIIGSRLLMVKKGPIEFQNNEGVQYLLKSMDLTKKINKTEIIDEKLKFLYNYGQRMYEKKLTNRSLPYFEFCAQNWWSLNEGSNETYEIINYLESKFGILITEGKFKQASRHLGSIISIKIFIGDSESAGISAYSFAKAAGGQGKQEIELEFLRRAYDGFVTAKATSKLQEMLDYVNQQVEPLFNLDSKTQEPREKFIQLGNTLSTSISEETQGGFLQAITFKALNTGLTELGIKTVDEAFDVIKKYNPKEAAEIYFKVGSLLLEKNMEKALDFVDKSTRFAMEIESLGEVIDRNLTFLEEQTLISPILSQKLLLSDKLETLSSLTKNTDRFNAFLFTLTKHLAEKVSQPDFFTETKNFVTKSFYGYYNQDPNHSKLEEIISWTNSHIMEAYSDTQLPQMYDLALVNLAFHEKINQAKEYIDFFWQLFNKFVSIEDFSHSIAYFKQTYETLNRMNESTEFITEFTGQVVGSLDRGIKPKIADEKFDEAWPLLEGLFSILIEAGLSSQAVDLYKNNSKHFAPHRLDLALTMWSQAIDTAKTINDTESISSIVKTINDDIIPLYIEKGIPRAVNQLYSAAASGHQALGNTTAMLATMLDGTRYNLSLSDFEAVHQLGIKGFDLATKSKNEEYLFEFSNMFFAIGSGLLSDDPEVGINLIETASDYLREYGPKGYDHYLTKMAEIFEPLYNTPITQKVAQNERARILQHFKDSGKKVEEGRFLVTSAKLSFQAGNINEGLDLISQGTAILKELEDEDGLGEIVSVCLKTAANYSVGTDEYIALSRHAASVQETATVEISEEKTQEAFGDLFDGLLDDMTKLMDPAEREKRQKEKKRKRR